MMDFYKKIKPKLVVPMHGEKRHLIGHKKILDEKKIRAEIVRNGEIIEIDKQIDQEIKNGVIPDPSAVDPITGEPLPQDGGQNALGDVPMEPEIDGSITEV